MERGKGRGFSYLAVEIDGMETEVVANLAEALEMEVGGRLDRGEE